MKTRTGQWSIGMRRGGSEWQRDLGQLIDWAVDNDLEVIDLGKDGDTGAPQVVDAGLKVGSADLPAWQEMITADRNQRADAVARNAAYIETCAAAGVSNFFLVMLPADSEAPRRENFDHMVAGFGELAGHLEAHDAKLVIEGWPGPGALCCTPEGLRAFFREVPSKAMGVNYDPSHLVRMGIDYLRFLHEFGDRAYHVHGKDTELLTENLYTYGHEQPATFADRIRYGAHAWRYTIPGQGIVRWKAIFDGLQDAGYDGCVSIELEDANFNGAEATEKAGILHGARFLAGC